jgi:hypothetical protein
VIAKALQTSDPSPRSVFWLSPGAEVGPGVTIRLLPLHHVIGQDQDRVGHREHGPLLPTPRRQASVWRTERGAFRPGGRGRRLPQGGPPATMALAGLPRRPLARARMGAGGDAGPGGRMARPGAARHIRAELGDEHLGRAAGHPRNGSQQVHGLVKRAADDWAWRITAGDGLIEAIDLTPQLRPHQPVLRCHPASQRLRPPGPSAAQAACGQLGQGVGGGVAGDQGRQPRAARDRHDGRRDRRELDVGVFQELLHAVHQGHPLPAQGAAVACQVPQCPLRHGGDDAGAQHAMPQALRQPGGIFAIGLAPGHRFDMVGIDQQHLAATFQDIEYGRPGVTSTLDGDRGAPTGEQPIGEREQRNGHRPEGADLLTPAPMPIGGYHTGHHRLLVDVQTSAPLVHDGHNHLRGKARRLAWSP